MSYITRKMRAASARGRMMAARRWELDRKRRETVAAMEPVKFSGRIVRRIIVIENETSVRETIIYDFDSRRDMQRKLRNLL